MIVALTIAVVLLTVAVIGVGIGAAVELLDQGARIDALSHRVYMLEKENDDHAAKV